ncbi:biotin--[acetyl-CoA-carboxylase] ligase [Clostridium tetani]|uniref:Bifunctional ligase/repressor BirA n=1 Tax=Clostridium tetani TaxID=1513 RepID=A0ABY0EMR4_CLOTA|nr:biotin--[acetyl-CoA-carboxylase] ligase [Clostridium tetani]CDI48907.1 transcriptional repressor of the biotin operonbirA [Clostridium tetani 12124569]KHO39805.1 biotin--acetyl-CoA-carboxylase ligase [Clostridium tetani]RXI38469.1 biotin--[acetyl-CoA-carboxylase] ligase [Clostridium tetani]RXI54227.1 biotin--[acetyl-CoA-carboxylase] ligase [Clostridium tetani]RXI68889.1 biotin--[acetyl-CoA-carboxylase] ligase [Clostridium tetani]
MKEAILKLLKLNRDTFLSGQCISDEFQVSRTAIWKCMNSLREMGYEIESVPNRGYKLISTPDILTYEEIEPYLNTINMGRNIMYYKEVDSTNNKAKELALNSPEGTVVISELQTSGRGRLGRDWYSPFGKGIYMSTILKPDVDPVNASKITQIAAAALCKSFNEIGIKSYIKWPNDIIINNKKVCGILTEMDAELNQINYIILGIGANVNMEKDSFPEEISNIASSLKIESGIHINRQELVSTILNNFEILYNEYLNKKNILSSIKICRENSILLGKEIKIIKGNEVLQGIAMNIDDEGLLIIKDKYDNLNKIISGEVSIRGLNSYV